MKNGRRSGSVAGVIALAVLVAGCSDRSTPKAESTSAPPSSVVSTPATSSAAPTSSVPSYTPPPSRGVPRPPGLKLPPNACSSAIIAGHGFAGAWFSGAAAYAQDGETVPGFQWDDAVRVLPSFLSGVPKTRGVLQRAGVPANHVVFRDLTELDAAMKAAIAVAKARDDSKVLSVYFRARTALDRFVESCGAVEGPAGN